MKGEHPVRMLCGLLNASPSGYYRWRQHRPSTRQCEDAAIAAKVAAAHRASRGTYGAPRIVEDLREEGTRTSKRRCARLMREQGLRGKKKNRRRPRTTDSRHAQPVAANVIAERPAPSGPNQAWRTDITYLKTAEGSWPPFSMPGVVALSAGHVRRRCTPAWPLPPSRTLLSGAGRPRDCYITPTAAASTLTPSMSRY